LSMHKYNIMAP